MSNTPKYKIPEEMIQEHKIQSSSNKNGFELILIKE